MASDTHPQLEVIAELNWEPSVTAAPSLSRLSKANQRR